MAPKKNPKNVTLVGRLSFPTFTAREAYDLSLKGDYPAADVASAAPHFQMLLEQAQVDKLMNHIEQEFFPYCIEQEKAGEKRDKLSAKEVKDLTAQLHTPDFEGNFNTPFKPVHEKTAALAPEAMAAVKCIGGKGTDIELKAIIQDEDELAVPDPDQIKFPCIKPINASVHSMYPGAYVTATLNLYAYHNGKLPGFSAGAGVLVFKADADRFGGGAAIDEDEMFLD